MRNTQMDNFDYAFYDECLDYIDYEGIRVLHVFEKGQPAKGGYTVAYKQHVLPNGTPGKQVQVAVAYCSDKDFFIRKIGLSQAVANFMDGSTIQVPVGEKDNGLTVHNLRRMFQPVRMSEW
jgi:hypothetical protein